MLELTSGVILWVVAVLLEVEAIVWAPDGQQVPYWKGEIAALNHIAAYQRALAYADHIETLLSENIMLLDFVTSLVGLLD